MSEQLFLAFSTCLHSSQFRDLARHVDFPNAFIRDRKQPLPALLALFLSGMRKSIQAERRRFPATGSGDLYHQRWRIEEAFKRLKHRLNLEYVSGLSQLEAMQYFAAKIVL